MANKCGDCQLFQGSGVKYGGGRSSIGLSTSAYIENINIDGLRYLDFFEKHLG
jgi:hypothetical protein